MVRLARGSYRAVGPEHYGTPKELWGFRTRPQPGGPARVARAFLRANAGLLGIDAGLASLQHQKTLGSLGAHHVIFQQRHQGLRVHRAYVTVHVARDACVYLVKNRAMPAPLLPAGSRTGLARAELLRRARRALPAGRRRARVQDVETLWFPSSGRLEPAVRVRLARVRPREEWIVYVQARSGRILSRYDNLAAARGRARVFQPSPVTALGDHADLRTPGGRLRRPPPEAYRTVSLYGLDASGRLEGRRVTTSPTAANRRVRRRDRRFLLDSTDRGFEEVMVYHHVDSALRYLARLGFRGARAIFREPVRANVNGSAEDNSWYSPWDRLLTFGTGGVDDAEDGETILHELGHAIQDAIVPDFGQSVQAAAMGEGFGDYFAASFFADAKPARYRTAVMTWDGLEIGLAAGIDPPALRYLDWDWTADDFQPGGSEHDNGEIWSATLWDVREALGGQAADRLILESHYQLDGFTSFERGARAIIDADRNLNRGRNRERLRRLFRQRRIGPV